MRLSVKPRYAIASLLVLARHYEERRYLSLIQLSEELGLSKIYLEQVFSLLKRAQLVLATKGAQGGYLLAAPPEAISLEAIFRATETALFEATDPTLDTKLKPSLKGLEAAMRQVLFDKLDDALASVLKPLTLSALFHETAQRAEEGDHMYYL